MSEFEGKVVLVTGAGHGIGRATTVLFARQGAHMQASGGGVIINTASVDGQIGFSTLAPYVCAKHGVIGLTKTTALECAEDNIRALAIAPGYIDTNMTAVFRQDQKDLVASMIPLGRPAAPEEVGNMVTWLASDKASYVTGTCINIDAGMMAGINFPG